MHNLFIAIVERSFSSLKDNPRIRGDESSDEETEESLNDEGKKKKLQSRQAFNMILNSGNKSQKAFFDENTLVQVQNMNAILDDHIIESMKMLAQQVEKYEKGTKEYEAAKEHLLNLIDLQFLPVLDHFI